MLRIGLIYDVRGLVQNVTSYSDIAGEELVNEVQNVYNGFRQLVTQYQEHDGAVNTSTSPSVQYTYADGSVNTVRRTGIIYPNGRVLNYVYNSGDDDNLSRVSSLGDDSFSPLAAYTYLGASAIVVADYQQPGVQYSLISGNVVAWDSFTLAQWQAFTLDQWAAFRLDVSPYGGLDQFDRIINNLWQTDGETPVAIDQVNYGYDLASNRLWRQNPVAQANSQNRDELYAYDGLYQLLDLSRGQLNDDETAINSGTLNFAQAWELDPTGNWTDYKEDDTGGGFTFYETRAANAVNEITALTTTDPAWVTPAYDANGNMTTMPQPAAPSSSYTAVYDAWNRLVGLMDGDEIVAGYAYDGLGRRTTKDIGGTIRDYYYSNDWQVLEEWLASAVERQFVWGLRYIDDLVCRDRDPDGSGSLSERIYPLQDANANVTALSDDSGTILERYVYSAYGVLTVLNPDFSVKGGSPSYDWEILYASYRWDSESGLYLARYRYFHPPLGVWITRDPIGFRGGDRNLYRYVRSRPISFYDPTGTVLIAVDGTSSRAWTRDARSHQHFGRLSHVYNFYLDYILSPSESGAYFFHGPALPGGDVNSILDLVMKYLSDALSEKPCQPINMVGHSRGGLVVIEAARRLKDGIIVSGRSGSKSRRSFNVNFLGLYDPVDMAIGSGAFSETIPSNVDHVANAVSDPLVKSRWYWNRINGGPETPNPHFNQLSFFANHSGMGGAPNAGDALENTTPAIQWQESARVDAWVRSIAEQADIKLKPSSFPSNGPDSSPDPWLEIGRPARNVAEFFYPLKSDSQNINDW